MIRLSKDQTKRLIAVHGWSGVVLGLFLYVVILTGAVAVFAHDIGQWSISGTKAAHPLAEPVYDDLLAQAESVDDKYLEEVGVYYNSAGNIVSFFHTHGMNASGQPDDVGIMFEMDPNTREILSRKEGFGTDLYGGDPSGALDQFIVDLHVNLHAPSPWGLYATGILGLVMLVAAGSGLLIHRHLLKDIFVAPRYSSALLHKRDRHILAGSWGLPFAFVLAFTGSFLSFALALGLPLVSQTAFGGDQFAMFETMIGQPIEEDSSPAPLTDLDAVLAASTRIAGSVPEGITISHWGRADAAIQIYHPSAEGQINGRNQLFAGATGDYLGLKPSLGTAPSAGNTAFNLMGALHFGLFAGYLSKVIWFSLGIAMCYVTLTGLQLWIQRRADNPFWQKLSRGVTIFGYGTPIALAGAAIGFFVSLPTGSTLFWTPAGFIIAAILTAIYGSLEPGRKRLDRVLKSVLATSLFILPVLRMSLGGAGWGAAASSGNMVVISVDLTLLIAAAGLFVDTFYVRIHREKLTRQPLGGAAE